MPSRRVGWWLVAGLLGLSLLLLLLLHPCLYVRMLVQELIVFIGMHPNRSWRVYISIYLIHMRALLACYILFGNRRGVPRMDADYPHRTAGPILQEELYYLSDWPCQVIWKISDLGICDAREQSIRTRFRSGTAAVYICCTPISACGTRD